jgi:hypothetical protein
LPNNWAIDEDKGEDKHDADNSTHQPVISSSIEEELERPSFLRRLTKRHHTDAEEDDAAADKPGDKDDKKPDDKDKK